MEEVGSVRMKNSPETTQVLIVLSDNGVEEIPFQSNHEKSENNVNYMEVNIYCFIFQLSLYSYLAFESTLGQKLSRAESFARKKSREIEDIKFRE